MENKSEITIQQELTALSPWFHNLHLDKGIQTAPDHFLGDFPSFKWKQIAPEIPEDLHGWKILDIGCNAGFYSFELAKRGAEVLGIDIDRHYLKQAEWAAGKLNLRQKVKFKQMQVYHLAKLKDTFDMIWFMGVFYHLRYPLLALDIISRKTKNLLVIQTLSMPGDQVLQTKDNYSINDRAEMLKEGWPKMAFIEKQLAGDPTNWWAPNKAAVEAMLRSCGMKISAYPGPETYICQPDPEFVPAYPMENPLELFKPN